MTDFVEEPKTHWSGEMEVAQVNQSPAKWKLTYFSREGT